MCACSFKRKDLWLRLNCNKSHLSDTKFSSVASPLKGHHSTTLTCAIYRRVSSQFREPRVGGFWEEGLAIFFDLSLFFDAFWKQRLLKMLILALYNSKDLPLAAKDRKINTPVNNRKIKLNIFQTKSYRD